MMDKIRLVIDKINSNVDVMSVSELQSLMDSMVAVKMPVPDEVIHAYEVALNWERPGAGYWQVLRNGRKVRHILRLIR